MGDQQYVLRWNKHHENLSNGVIKYFKRELMCDVTITVGPGQKLKAHQAILSACSPYFESIFTENTHQNVTVMMVNVDHEILTAIIEYMYKGEVNIAQKLLPDFLKTAAHFQVKGLVDPENIGHNSEYDQHLTSTSPPSENNISRHLESRFLNRQLITERYDENESDSMNKDYDSINDIENRAELSPNFDDHIRKRRKDSNCDNNSSQKRLHRTPSESHASSHSSYKISPLPKSNSNDIDTSEGKRKSPSDHANILPHQPSIKQEERESDVAGSPQVHLSSNPLNSMYTPGSGIPPPPFQQGPVDILNSVGLHANSEPENEQPIPHIEPGNEIDGAEGVFIDSHHKSPPPNGNLEVFNFSSSYPMHNNSLRAKIRYSRPPVVDNYAPMSIIQSSMQHQVPNQIHDENTVKWAPSLSSIDLGQSPEYPDRSRLPKPSLNQPMSYHNMFIPSQEPGTLWKCRLCGKEVTNRWHHFHSHTAQRSLCPYCPATYSRIDTLRMHLKQKHRREMGKASQSPFSQLPDSGIGLPLANISTSGDFCSGQNKANKIKRRRETNESQELSP